MIHLLEFTWDECASDKHQVQVHMGGRVIALLAAARIMDVLIDWGAKWCMATSSLWVVVMGFWWPGAWVSSPLRPGHRRRKEADVLINVMCSHSISYHRCGSFFLPPPPPPPNMISHCIISLLWKILVTLPSYYHWWELPQVSFLLQQKFCHDKHIFCHDESMLVMTKLLSRQT